MGKDRFSPREAELDHCYTHKRHRRLAKADSPATARACGELAKGSPRRGRCLNLPKYSYCRYHKAFLRYSPTAATHENDLTTQPSPPRPPRYPAQTPKYSHRRLPTQTPNPRPAAPTAPSNAPRRTQPASPPRNHHNFQLFLYLRNPIKLILCGLFDSPIL